MLQYLKYAGIVCAVSIVANYTVAWIGALHYVQRPIVGGTYDSRGWRYDIKTNRVGTVVYATPAFVVPPGSTDNSESAPHWSVLQRSPTSAEGAAGRWQWEEAYGWPFRSVMSSHVMTKELPNSYVWTSRHAVIVPTRRDNRRALNVPVALPLKPIVIGLAVNTLVYAPVVLMLIFVAGKSQQFARGLRGRCTKCGYPIMTDIGRCSECGHDADSS